VRGMHVAVAAALANVHDLVQAEGSLA
jgi:hypothetical protein